MPYRPTPLNAPRLAGVALRLFAAAAETPFVGAPLRRAMLKSAGVAALRATPAAAPPDPPPPPPRPPENAPPRTDSLPTFSPHSDPNPAPFPPLPSPIPTPSPLEPASAFTAAYRAKLSTPAQTATRFLAAAARSDQSNPPLRAFITLSHDLPTQAAASTSRYNTNNPLSPLDGVPVAIKDELDLTGLPTTAGTRFLNASPADAATEDATAVARLRAAGALLLGKTNMQEAGLGVTGINPHHGSPRNPHDPSRITGGSSSGSAAAVAAGLCPIALSADAGGSIRIPAALCGVVGLKPTFTRVSEHGAVPLGKTLAHVGVIAATAEDAALAYETIAGPDPRDPATLSQPAPIAPDLSNPTLHGLTIGVFRPWFEDADAEVVRVCDAAVAALQSAGAEVREVEIPDLHLVRPVHLVTVATEWAELFARPHAAHRRRFGHDVRLILALAESLRATDYPHAQELRRQIRAHFDSALREVDVIATPATACTAPPLRPDALRTGESDFTTLDRLTRFALAANLTGLPAISFPAGYNPAGLPVGLQLIGRAWTEDVLLRCAACAGRLIERRVPRMHYRLLEETG